MRVKPCNRTRGKEWLELRPTPLLEYIRLTTISLSRLWTNKAGMTKSKQELFCIKSHPRLELAPVLIRERPNPWLLVSSRPKMHSKRPPPSKTTFWVATQITFSRRWSIPRSLTAVSDQLKISNRPSSSALHNPRANCKPSRRIFRMSSWIFCVQKIMMDQPIRARSKKPRWLRKAIPPYPQTTWAQKNWLFTKNFKTE